MSSFFFFRCLAFTFFKFNDSNYSGAGLPKKKKIKTQRQQQQEQRMKYNLLSQAHPRTSKKKSTENEMDSKGSIILIPFSLKFAF